MAEVVELQMNANQAFDVMGQLQARAGAVDNSFSNIGRGGGDFSENFLRSERRVARSAANIASNVLTSNDAVATLAATFLQLEYATRLGLGVGVGVAIGIAAFEVFHKQIVATHEAEQALDKDLSKPKSLVLALSTSDLKSEAQSVQKEIDETRKQEGSTTQGVLDYLKFGPVRSHEKDELEGERAARIANSQARIRDIQGQIGKNLLFDADLQDRVATRSQAEAEAKKVTRDAEQQISALRLAARSVPDAGLEQEIKAVQKLKQEKLDEIKLKESLSKNSLFGEMAKADFRGTTEERKDANLDIDLKTALKAQELLKDKGKEEERAKALLDVSKAQLAIDERRVEKAQQQRDLSATREETSIKVKGAQERVNLTGEDAQRSSLREQLDMAREKVGVAQRNLAADATSISNQKAITVAYGEQQIAMANLQKFDKERVFNSTQELNNAKSKTRELQLQAAGNTFAAGQEKINAPAESQIAKLLHDNKPVIASEVAAQANLQGEAALGARLTETAPQQRAREDAERAAKAQADAAHAAVLDAQNRERNGATLDENNPVTQQLRAEQERAAQLAEGEKPKSAEDFSSVASLAGQDFSSLASLGSLDFSGIATLAGLKITIA